MSRDVTAVGNAASARKSQITGTVTLTGYRVSKSENGHFIVNQDYTVVPPKGRSLGDCYPSYVPSKTNTFETAAEKEAHLKTLDGELAAS